MNTDSLFPKKCEGFLVEQMDSEVVLLHPARNIIIHGNATAALVWQLCDGVRTVDEIMEVLTGVYPEAGAQIAVDVPNTIQQLRAQGALEGGRG